ncbi:MAG: peptide/nickel transport system permease protein [Gaiellales bacterium]|jgi:peptide/nickel transport system permease protein|nr:peptide/nickel transport system permease protein [Gaiellales bacterium]
MRRLIAEKLGLALITVAFVLTFNFFLFRAIGDPRNDLLRVPHMTEVQRAHLIHERGLDGSLLDQYGIYLRNTLRGELEISYHSNRPVADVIGEALPNTLILALPATLLAALLGTWMGTVSARRRGTAADGALTGGAVTFYSMPVQFLAIALVLVFSIWLKAFPSQLSEQPGTTAHGLSHVWDVSQHAALPVLTLTLSILASWSLIMRASLSETLREDYMTTARAIGLSPRRAVLRHAVPNALLPVIALTAMSLGYVVSGVILIESVFSWPGIGQVTYDALLNRDLPVLQGVFLLSCAAVILMNLIADLLILALDPRVRAR